ADVHGPAARLGALLSCIADPDRDDVAALWADAWSIGRTNAALAAAARGVMDDWQRLATGIVGEGVRAGVMRVDDPDAVGRLLFALVDATTRRRRATWRADTAPPVPDARGAPAHR
ncbi:hypothetical protein IAE22_32785, partial [Bacillus sp. S34]|nr:hypothetical protein [Bacillus sp. S34]